MTMFRNFKNQSQRFTTICGIMYRYKKAEMLYGKSSALEKFLDDTMEDECQKEKISVEEVIFFTSLEAKC